MVLRDGVARAVALTALFVVALRASEARAHAFWGGIDSGTSDVIGDARCGAFVDGARACARVTPKMIVADGVSLFREYSFVSEIVNEGETELVVHGVSVDNDCWWLTDFVSGETIAAGEKRAYDVRFSPTRVGDFWQTLLFNTSAGLLSQLTPNIVYRSPYEFTALSETVPFDVPVEFDLQVFNPTLQKLTILSAMTTTPEVELEPSLFSVAQPSVTAKRGFVSEDEDRVIRAARWTLNPGEHSSVIRMRVLIRREEFLASTDDRKAIEGVIALNMTSETSLTRIPFSFTPRRDLVYVVEKHVAFQDLTGARDKSTKFLHVFNARKTAIEIRSVFTEEPDRDLSIKYGKGTIVPPLTTVRIARLTRVGNIEGYFVGVLRVHTNVSTPAIRIPYEAHVLHGALSFDADQLLFQAPVGVYGEAVPEGEHVVRKTIVLTNTFSRDVMLSSWRVPRSMLSAFPISGISSVSGSVIRAGESMRVALDFQPRFYGAAMTTMLTILHNNTRAGTNIPIIVYSGELTVQSKVDLGVLGVGLKRKMQVKFVNHNPVAVEINTMRITGTRSIKGVSFSLRDDAQSEVYAEDVFDIDGCIELSGTVCTQVVKGRLEPGGVLELRLTAAPLVAENLGDEGAELALTTNLGVETSTQLHLVATTGRVFSEDTDLRIVIPITDLFKQASSPIRREVTVHSTHEVPVTVSGFLETDSDFLEFEGLSDVAVAAGQSHSIGEISFDTTRQASELSRFVAASVGKSGSKSFAKRSNVLEDSDYLEAPLSKVDVRRLEMMQRAMDRLKEDGALSASGKLVFASEAESGHQTIRVSAKIEYPTFLGTDSRRMENLEAYDHEIVVAKDVMNTITVKNPSKSRALCVRVLPILTHSTPTNRWSGRKPATKGRTLLETNMKAARAYASVDESSLRQMSTDPGFAPKYLIHDEAVCVRPEQQMDVLAVVFNPRMRMRTYTASVCIKNDHTLLECIKMTGYSGNTVVEMEPPTGTPIRLRVALALACVAVVYVTAARRESEPESPASSPIGDARNALFENDATEALVVRKKLEPEVVGEPEHVSSVLASSEPVIHVEQRTSLSEALTHKSDDSALVVQSEVTTEQKPDSFRPSPSRAEAAEDSRSRDSAVDDATIGSERVSSDRKKEKEKSSRAAKPKVKVDNSRRHAGESPLPTTSIPASTQGVLMSHESSSNDRSSRMPQPRSVLRHHTLSQVLSERSEVSSQPDEETTPEALFDMYNSLYAEVLPAQPVSQRVTGQAPPIFASPATAHDYNTPPGSLREHISPPTSVREYITPPGSVQDFDMFTARAPGSVSGLHMGNLFSFRSDAGQRVTPERSTHSDLLSPASSMGRAGWRTMLSEWEERQDRDGDRRTSSRAPSHSPHTSHESFSQ